KIPKKIRTVKNILKIEETKGCPYYIARVIKNVKVGPSPKWLKERIEAIGLRPVNNIVDISNYVLYEYGEPMHAFDLDKLTEQRVIVRRARQGEKMPAINDKTYQLEPDMLVIADSKKPVAIAGVMGGKLTEVSEQTTNLLLETAYFNPAMVRKTSRQLALISDSSYRFERGVTPSTIDPASRRAVELILKLAGGELTEEQIINRLKQKPKQIIVRFDRANKVLGITVKKPEVKRILKGLGFKIKNESASQLKVEIPDFRSDVDREIDLIEEIALVHGYENIPASPPPVVPQIKEKNVFESTNELLRRLLTGLGYNESMTTSFLEPQYQPDFTFWSEEKLLGLVNPGGAEDKFMRNSLAPSLLAVNKINENYDHTATLKLFEIAKAYYGTDQEKLVLGVLDNQGFYSLKGTLSTLWQQLNISKISYQEVKLAGLEPTRSIKIMSGLKTLGYFGELNTGAQEKYETQKPVAVAELDFEEIVKLTCTDISYQEFTRLPGIERDLALVVDEKVRWNQIESVIKQKSGQFMESVNFFDLYRGKQIPKGKKSLAFSVSFRSPDRTLKSEEIDTVMNNIISTLEQQFQASLRK
ncbi:MAG: phenylalanine--tRNA ligase subunit beta, partial [Planctomycetes bacterium]|nr:phenylalanine--tRNA ligase subunit beta [Planctomycetota bacterium]